MQPVKQHILDLALEKYAMAVVSVAGKPTLFKLIDGAGKMVIQEYFSNRARAELKLMALVEEKEKKNKTK